MVWHIIGIVIGSCLAILGIILGGRMDNLFLQIVPPSFISAFIIGTECSILSEWRDHKKEDRIILSFKQYKTFYNISSCKYEEHSLCIHYYPHSVPKNRDAWYLYMHDELYPSNIIFFRTLVDYYMYWLSDDIEKIIEKIKKRKIKKNKNKIKQDQSMFNYLKYVQKDIDSTNESIEKMIRKFQERMKENDKA